MHAALALPGKHARNMRAVSLPDWQQEVPGHFQRPRTSQTATMPMWSNSQLTCIMKGIPSPMIIA